MYLIYATYEYHYCQVFLGSATVKWEVLIVKDYELHNSWELLSKDHLKFVGDFPNSFTHYNSVTQLIFIDFLIHFE